MPNFASSTAFRFAAFFSIAFTLVTLALGAGIYWSIRSQLRYDLDQRVVAERASVLRQAATSGLATAVRDRNGRDHGDLRYALLDGNGRLVAGQPIVARPPLGWSAM